jgi:hypothetical protein
MKTVIFVIVVCLFFAQAEAARIKDLSLSPTESFKEPDISSTHTPTIDNNQAPGTPSQPMPGKDTKRFMSAYCNAAAMPTTSNSNALSACLKKTHEEACARFLRLPEDAQAAVDQKIVCTNSFTRSDDGAASELCKSTDASYVQILEKHTKDTDTVYGMAAIPKMVNDPMNLCASQ